MRRSPPYARGPALPVRPARRLCRTDLPAHSAWVRARLAALEDESELYDILVDSWRQAAPADLAERQLP